LPECLPHTSSPFLAHSSSVAPLDQAQIQRRFRESWTNKGQSARKKLEFLRSFFRFCVDSGWMKVNVAKLIKLPIASSAPVLRFTVKEIEAILTAPSLRQIPEQKESYSAPRAGVADDDQWSEVGRCSKPAPRENQ
jgi:site-specific recombinase XerD